MPQEVLKIDIIQSIQAHFVSVKADVSSLSTAELTESKNKLTSLKNLVSAYADLSRETSLAVKNGADIGEANQTLGVFHAALSQAIEAAQEFVNNYQGSHSKLMALQLKLCKLHPATVEGMAQRLEDQGQQHAGLVSVNKAMSSLAIGHSVVREALPASNQYNAPNVFRAALQAVPANNGRFVEAEGAAIAAG
jgi:hypothetical protein